MALVCAWIKTGMNTAVDPPESAHSLSPLLHTIYVFLSFVSYIRGGAAPLEISPKGSFELSQLGCTRRLDLFVSFLSMYFYIGVGRGASAPALRITAQWLMLFYVAGLCLVTVITSLSGGSLRSEL